MLCVWKGGPEPMEFRTSDATCERCLKAFREALQSANAVICSQQLRISGADPETPLQSLVLSSLPVVHKKKAAKKPSYRPFFRVDPRRRPVVVEVPMVKKDNEMKVDTMSLPQPSGIVTMR